MERNEGVDSLRQLLVNRREKAEAESCRGGSLQHEAHQMISYHQNVGNTFEQVMADLNYPKGDKPELTNQKSPEDHYWSNPFCERIF